MSEPTIFEEIRALTHELRHANGRYWSDLRDLVRERGIAADTLVVLDRIPEEGDLDFVAVVLEDSRVMEIEYADRHYVPRERPEIRAWLDVTPGTPEWSVYSDRIDVAHARRAEI
jgi:hypothetical protein